MSDESHYSLLPTSEEGIVKKRQVPFEYGKVLILFFILGVISYGFSIYLTNPQSEFKEFKIIKQTFENINEMVRPKEEEMINEKNEDKSERNQGSQIQNLTENQDLKNKAQLAEFQFSGNNLNQNQNSTKTVQNSSKIVQNLFQNGEVQKNDAEVQKNKNEVQSSNSSPQKEAENIFKVQKDSEEFNEVQNSKNNEENLKNITKVQNQVEGSQNIEEKPIQLRKVILEKERMLSANGRHIFFIESHLEAERKLENPRIACSIEAAARLNPDLSVYFLYATEASGVKLAPSKFTKILQSYSNIYLRFFNIFEYSKGTILEEFIKTGSWWESEFFLEHTSDILRTLTMWKFGGLYMDLDVIMLQPLRYLPKMNFLCLEVGETLASSVWQMDNENGKKYAEMCLNELKNTYQPFEWTSNGPELLTRVAKSLCPDVEFSATNFTTCDFLTIYPTEKYAPISNLEYKDFYTEQKAQESMEKIKKSYFAHIWNKMQEFGGERFDRVDLDSWAPYIELARTYCPRVYDSLEEYFKK